jgi:hypothetical protein
MKDMSLQARPAMRVTTDNHSTSDVPQSTDDRSTDINSCVKNIGLE